MDHHVKEFFRQSSDEFPSGHFHSVIALHDTPKTSWDEICKKAPQLCRGWYELAHLSPKDRIEFTCDFWMSKIPYRNGLEQLITSFFNSLDDIGIYLTQKRPSDPFEAHLIYSLKGDSGFYRGAPPITDKKLERLN